MQRYTDILVSSHVYSLKNNQRCRVQKQRRIIFWDGIFGNFKNSVLSFKTLTVFSSPPPNPNKKVIFQRILVVEMQNITMVIDLFLTIWFFFYYRYTWSMTSISCSLFFISRANCSLIIVSIFCTAASRAAQRT